MAINLKKPVSFSDDDVTTFQAKNPRRGKVKHVSFPNEENPEKPLEFWLVKPTRDQLEAIADAPNTSKGNDLLINSCVVAGDVDQIDGDVDLLLGLLRECSDMMEAKKKL